MRKEIRKKETGKKNKGKEKASGNDSMTIEENSGPASQLTDPRIRIGPNIKLSLLLAIEDMISSFLICD